MSLRPYLLDWVVNVISLSYSRHLRVWNSPLRQRLEIEAWINSGGLMMSISGLSSNPPPPLPAASHCLDVIFLSSARTVHLPVTWKLFDGPLLIFVVLWRKWLYPHWVIAHQRAECTVGPPFITHINGDRLCLCNMFVVCWVFVKPDAAFWFEHS